MDNDRPPLPPSLSGRRIPPPPRNPSAEDRLFERARSNSRRERAAALFGEEHDEEAAHQHRVERARLGSAQLDRERLRRQRELQRAQEAGVRRRRASEERQNELVERMARINRSSRDEEEGTQDESPSASGRNRSSGFSNRYSVSGAPGELIGGASRSRGSGSGRNSGRIQRGSDIDDAISHGMDEHLDLHGEEEGEALGRGRAMPLGGLFGALMGGQGDPMMGGGGLGGIMMGEGSPDALLAMLLRSRDNFLDQAEEMQMAMAMSLSLQDQGGGSEGADGDPLSYENLVDLEDVRVTVPPAVVKNFPVTHYNSSAAHNDADAKCAICQVEYAEGEELMKLPCQHSFHSECASEWLTSYSKNCPMCKTAAWEMP